MEFIQPGSCLFVVNTRLRVNGPGKINPYSFYSIFNLVCIVQWRLGVVGEVAGDPLAIRLSPPVICPSSRALVFLSTPSASVFNPYHQISPPPRGAIIWQFARIPPSTLKSYSLASPPCSFLQICEAAQVRSLLSIRS
ncbi:hypothetical protein PVAP13_J683221 [Panicum virgatum]|nr:hypothetical protein PVAP13_J683221 [Panicum virgatum]KAG2481318.1 hypothetical protein PVAP13_J683221 [Panicum virgatum]KAG2481325.1 hypothetical protein PVAP13_J683221 [Panicum virgatum]KAG2481326.1 hypothetical protein PVAP13_J683221 [Panicum virgatum]